MGNNRTKPANVVNYMETIHRRLHPKKKKYVPKSNKTHGDLKPSQKYKINETDRLSPKKRKISATRKRLEYELANNGIETPSPGCQIDPNENTQYCLTHNQKIHKCWIIQPENYTPHIMTLEDYMTPNNSPAEPEEEEIFTVSSDDDVEETP